MKLSYIIEIVDVIASIVLSSLLIFITIKQNQKLEKFQEKQDEQDRINRLKEYILQRMLPVLKDMSHTIISIEERILPLDNQNEKQNFVLIINNMMSYTDIIAKFVAHFNQMIPDVQDQDRVLHQYCFNILTEIAETVCIMMSNFDLINKMYYEYKTLVPALRRTFDMSECLFELFESTVIYGLGKNSREDSLEFLTMLYTKFLEDIKKDTKGKIRFETDNFTK